MTALHDMGVAELGRVLGAKEVSSVEVTSHLLARLAAHEELGALLGTDADHALAQARAADAQRRDGKGLGPLHGLPVGIKDIIDTADMPTQNGSLLFKGYQPPEDAFCVSALRAAGAVIMGKTNVPPNAADWQTDNPLFGRTGNPWNL
ncbi:MAG TPA: amidase, partial [Burkholderiaceae bacterium]|nr:amidase [Burkholderiaceae bacterium]